MKPAVARGYIITAALLWSTAGAAVKLTALGAPALAGGRALVAGLIIFLFRKESHGRWTRPVLLAACAYAATCGLFIWANTLTTAGNAIFIQDVAPVWVLLLGPRLLGERSTRAERISIPIALTGCALFFLDDLGAGRAIGNLLALASSVSYALLIISYRKLSEAESLSSNIAGSVIIVIVCAPFLALHPPAALETSDLLVLLYLGVIQQALATMAFVRGMRGVSALEASLLALLEPMASPVWAFLFVSEKLGWPALIGAALILGSTVWRTVKPSVV